MPLKWSRAGVVDQDVDAAENLDRAVHGRLHLFLEADVGHTRQPSAACGLDRRHRRVNRAGKFQMRLSGLRHYGDIGPVPCSADGDRLADAAARAGDEERLASEVRHRQPLPFCGDLPPALVLQIIHSARTPSQMALVLFQAKEKTR